MARINTLYVPQLLKCDNHRLHLIPPSCPDRIIMTSRNGPPLKAGKDTVKFSVRQTTATETGR